MKGIIAGTRADKAVLINERGEFVEIKNRGYAVGQRVSVRSEFYRLAYAAAGVVIFFSLGISASFAYCTPVSYMSIDINPSLQLAINCFDRVIDAVAFNEEASLVLETVSVKNQSIGASLDEIVTAAEDMGYLSGENKHIDIAADSESIAKAVSKSIDKYIEAGIDVALTQTGKSELAASKELGLSLGRAKAVLDYTNTFGGDLKTNASELSDVPVNNIKKAAKGGRPSPAPSNSLQTVQPLQSGETTQTPDFEKSEKVEEKFSNAKGGILKAAQPTFPPAHTLEKNSVKTWNTENESLPLAASESAASAQNVRENEVFSDKNSEDKAEKDSENKDFLNNSGKGTDSKSIGKDTVSEAADGNNGTDIKGDNGINANQQKENKYTQRDSKASPQPSESSDFSLKSNESESNSEASKTEDKAASSASENKADPKSEDNSNQPGPKPESGLDSSKSKSEGNEGSSDSKSTPAKDSEKSGRLKK